MRIRSTEDLTPIQDNTPPIGARVHQLPVDPRPTALAATGTDAMGALAQLIQSLRLSISAATQPGAAPARAIAVVGVDAAKEASFVATQLGLSYAQTGVTTVIVDAGSQAGTQHNLLGVNPGPGLAAVLSGTATEREATMATPVRDLSLLPSGHWEADSSLLTDCDRFHRSVMPLLEWRDMMIVDGGNVSGEPLAIYGVMDGVILVARRGKTRIEKMQHVIKQIGGMKTSVLGVVLSI